MFSSTLLFVLLGIITTIAVLVRRATNVRLPPGPPKLPILGNVLDVPRKHVGRELSQLSDKYGRSEMSCSESYFQTFAGDIFALDVIGRTIIVLGSQDVARELLEKRSTNYSDRPPSVMVKL